MSYPCSFLFLGPASTSVRFSIEVESRSVQILNLTKSMPGNPLTDIPHPDDESRAYFSAFSPLLPFYLPIAMKIPTPWCVDLKDCNELVSGSELMLTADSSTRVLSYTS